MKRSHLVTPAEEGQRVDVLLRRHFGVSSGHLRRIKRLDDGILCNGTRVFCDHKVRSGDRLECHVADLGTSRLTPCPLPLDTVWEDDWLTVVNKPAGMPTHPSSFSPNEPSVAGCYLYAKGGTFHPVNRLDTGTSGLMVVAANGYTHQLITPQLHQGTLRRTYLALCVGYFTQKEGTVEAPIGRKPGSIVERQVDPAGKPALTHYRVLQEKNGLSLVELSPQTGRTHQLRVHMAYLGHPLLGDFLYGEDNQTRPALHSYRLQMLHPVHKTPLELTAPLPQDMLKHVDLL